MQTDEDADDKPLIPDEPLSETRVKVTHRVKVAFFFIHLATAIAQFIMSAATNLFDFQANVVSLTRSDAAVDSSGTPGLRIDEIGPLFVNLVFAAANLFAAIAYVFCLFFNQDELDTITTGRMPYVWLAILFSNVPLYFAISLTAGVASWTELLLLASLVFAWTFIYWFGTYRNAIGRSASFAWAFWISALLLLVILTVVLIYTVAIKLSNGGPGIHLVPIIAALVFSVLIPLIVLTSYSGMFKRHTALIMLYITNSVGVVVVSWLGFVAFATDGITYP